MFGLKRFGRFMRALRQRERKGPAWPPIVAGILLMGVVGEVALGEHGVQAFAAAIRDPASILSARSPGERSPGAKFSTKGQRSARVAPLEQTRPPQAPAALQAVPLPSEPAPIAEALPETAILPAAYSAVPVAEDPGGIGSGFTPGSGFGPLLPLSFVPGGGTGEDPDGPPGGDTPPPPPPITAVPEPASWLMLIAGFFGLGWALRRRDRVAVQR